MEVVLLEVLLANLVEELDDAAEQFLRDALARAVDAELDGRSGVEHRRCKHRDADGFSKAPRSADEHLLRKMFPRVLLENLLVHLCEAADGLHLPERSGACLEEILVELALVKAAVPARSVQQCKCVATLAHALHGGFSLRPFAVLFSKPRQAAGQRRL